MKKIGIVITLLFLAQFAFAQKAIIVVKSGIGNPVIFLNIPNALIGHRYAASSELWTSLISTNGTPLKRLK